MWWSQAYTSIPLRYTATLTLDTAYAQRFMSSYKMGLAQFSATEDFGVYPNSRVRSHTLSLWPVAK